MRLTELIAAGAFIDEGVTKREVTWEGHTFDVWIKNEMSAADWEFVYGGTHLNKNVDVNDQAFSPRRIHRFVRLGDQGQDVVSYEDAVRMRTSLVLAICEAINAVHGEVTAKKKSPTTTSSGVSLSSTESAAKPLRKPRAK